MLVRLIITAILFTASGGGAAQTSVWQTVPASTSDPLQRFTPAPKQLAALRAVLLAWAIRRRVWECDNRSWLDGLTFYRMPLASRPVVLIEAGAGCARGGQGSNGAMWLVEWDGHVPRVIAAPDAEFGGWFFGIQAQKHYGFHDVVVGWHMSAFQSGLTYFQFNGKAYKATSGVTLSFDENGNSKIVAAAQPRK